MTVLVPDWVKANIDREEMVESTLEAIPYWNRLLKEIDPALGLVLAKENASGPGIVPGHWHVRRRNHGVPDSYKAITGPDGKSYRPMGSDILEELKQHRWEGDVADRVWRERAVQEKAKERADETAREARQDEFAYNLRAATRARKL